MNFLKDKLKSNLHTQLRGSCYCIAVLSGAIVVVRPELFKYVLLADLWLLGCYHVIANRTRLAFDRASLRRYRFYIYFLPFIVFVVIFLAAWTTGVWIVATVYLYWHLFHYARQSWRSSQVYRGKSGGLVDEKPLFSKSCFYLLPLHGIAHRSWQALSPLYRGLNNLEDAQQAIAGNSEFKRSLTGLSHYTQYEGH